MFVYWNGLQGWFHIYMLKKYSKILDILRNLVEIVFLEIEKNF